jgi:hypothetical protein
MISDLGKVSTETRGWDAGPSYDSFATKRLVNVFRLD